jgi:hypothetical protein
VGFRFFQESSRAKGTRMFRKKTSWYRLTLNALFFAGILYKTARLFMKSAEKLQREKKVKKKMR